jgi:LysM repeat protein
LGRHSKPSRTRIQRLLPVAAAPALAGVAAAFCLAPQALADPVAGPPPTSHTATLDAASPLGPSTQLLAAIRVTAPQQKAAVSQPASYTVKSGDSLSAIAQREYHSQAAWPVLYYANRSKIHWANDITPGQVLQVPAKPAKIPSAPGQLAPAAPVVAAAPVAQAATSSVIPAAKSVSSDTTSTATYTGGTPGGSFGSCVVAAESGGNSQVMNSSGHYGLYQFSESTWEEYGGSASDFGNASAGEQNQVFANALAAGGQSNWSAYDGC